MDVPIVKIDTLIILVLSRVREWWRTQRGRRWWEGELLPLRVAARVAADAGGGAEAALPAAHARDGAGADWTVGELLRMPLMPVEAA
jgi:hypothetical protein